MTTCAIMAAESDVNILLTYYNNQIRLNTPEGNVCAATLASKINTILQSNLSKPPSVELREDMISLLQLTEDAQVLSKQARASTFFWLSVVVVILSIIAFLNKNK